MGRDEGPIRTLRVILADPPADLRLVELSAPGVLSSTQGNANQPKHKEYDSNNPKNVQGESRSSQDQHQQE
jgi:hypothetical protein